LFSISDSLSVLRTYKDAKRIIKAFVKPDGLNCVIMVGPPGVGKTNTFFPLCEGAELFECGLSPVKMYCRLYHARNRTVVFDDVDDLLALPAGVNLLKCLCQTDKVKRIAWDKASAVLKDEGVPTRFDTRSRVLILANTLKRLEENLAAVLDRAHAFRFEPSVIEIHRQVRWWFRDKQIYNFIGEHLNVMQTLSMRDYFKAAERKKAGLPWRSWLLERWSVNPKVTRVLELLDQSVSPSVRKATFTREGLGSEATYKRVLAKANGLRRGLRLAV